VAGCENARRVGDSYFDGLDSGLRKADPEPARGKLFADNPALQALRHDQ